MALQTDYTSKQMHELFHQFLMGKFEGDMAEANVIVETAEVVLPFTLNEHFGTGYGTIYDLQDEGEIEDLRKKIKAHPVLKNIDKREEPRYTEVLKWYRLFVKSLHKDTTPILVPGEEEDFPTMVADNPEPPVEHNDADYAPDSEGLEHQYNLTNGKAYGDIGEGYIEIHHVNPHHTFEGVHMVDPANDLIPLCSNCHSMIHRVEGQGKCMTLRELKDHYKGIKYND